MDRSSTPRYSAKFDLGYGLEWVAGHPAQMLDDWADLVCMPTPGRTEMRMLVAGGGKDQGG